MGRNILAVLTAVLVLVVAGAYVVLVPAEAVRPPPATVAKPNLVSIPTPFTHRWSKGTSHPLLAAAAIDVDDSGRDAVFLGGSDGQPDALLAWRDGDLVLEIENFASEDAIVTRFLDLAGAHRPHGATIQTTSQTGAHLTSHSGSTSPKRCSIMKVSSGSGRRRPGETCRP